MIQINYFEMLALKCLRDGVYHLELILGSNDMRRIIEGGLHRHVRGNNNDAVGTMGMIIIFIVNTEMQTQVSMVFEQTKDNGGR